MDKQLDILFIHSNSSKEIYQDLSKEYSAIEPPLWAGLLAKSCRDKGFSVDILNCELLRLDSKKSAKTINDIDPRIACFVCYGSQPSASSQSMEGAVSTVKEFKRINAKAKTMFVGGHVSALPLEVLAYKEIDFVGQNESVYCLHNLLSCDNLDDKFILEKVKGLGWKDEERLILNPIGSIVSQENLSRDLGGIAWDLIAKNGFKEFRTSGWHAWASDLNNNAGQISKNNFSSIYSSLGCPFKCFPEGTKVIVADAPNTAIQNIKLGAKLIGYDEKTGKLAQTEVIRLVENEEKNYLLSIKFENGRTIRCTEEHPFYVHGRWIEAKNLEIGQEIHSMNFREKIAFHKTICNYSFTQEGKEKISTRMKEVFASGKQKIPFLEKDYAKNYPPYSKNPERKEINCLAASQRMKENNPMFSVATCEKVSKTQKLKIKNGENIPFMCTPEYWEKLKNCPNKMEIKFLELLEKHFPAEWEFVGDGTVRLDYYSPDFINKNGKKKIIEFNGCYWHKCSMCHPEFLNENNTRARDMDRIKTYEKHGYKTLEVWQHDLKDEEKLIKTIGEFLYNGIKIIEIEKYNLRKPVKVYNFECSPHNNYFVGLSRASSDYILSHNCSFCMINTVNRTDNTPGVTADKSAIFRYWNPEDTIKELDYLANNGVVHLKFADEMAILKDEHFMKLCDLIAERKYGFNIWCYGRADVTKPRHLEKLRKAGIKYIALGIESPNQTVRKDVIKGGYQEVKIRDLVKTIHDEGINVGANYIFGLGLDNQNTMQETLDFAMDLNTPNANFYSCMPYPGSSLFYQSREYGWTPPEKFSGYSQHSYDTQNSPSKYLSAAEILKFRDEAWYKYFSNPTYLALIRNKFGEGAAIDIENSLKIKLKRKLLGDPDPNTESSL